MNNLNKIRVTNILNNLSKIELFMNNMNNYK